MHARTARCFLLLAARCCCCWLLLAAAAGAAAWAPERPLPRPPATTPPASANPLPLLHYHSAYLVYTVHVGTGSCFVVTGIFLWT